MVRRPTGFTEPDLHPASTMWRAIWSAEFRDRSEFFPRAVHARRQLRHEVVFETAWLDWNPDQVLSQGLFKCRVQNAGCGMMRLPGARWKAPKIATGPRPAL